VERLLWGIVLLIQFQAMCSVAASGSVDAFPRVYYVISKLPFFHFVCHTYVHCYISLCLLLFLVLREELAPIV
jgi:hypothetical protein